MPRRLLLFTLLAAGAVMAQVELSPKVFEIAARLRCPVCISETVAQSSSGTAEEMRTLIATKLAAGESQQQIFAYFQQRYGDWILLDPPRRGIYLVVWLLPGVVAAGLVLGLALLVAEWTRRGRRPIDVDEDALAALQRGMAQQERP